MAPLEDSSIPVAVLDLSNFSSTSLPVDRKACGASTPLTGSPYSAGSSRSRGFLARDYENRFGGSIFEAITPSSAQTPRSPKKAGVTQFTDPHNPSARNVSKGIPKVEEIRSDVTRAGLRSATGSMIPVAHPTGERHQPTPEGRYKVVAYRYGGQDWRPGKRCPDASPTSNHGWRSPRCSEGAAGSLTFGSTQKGGVLENYLNDMKKSKAALRVAPNSMRTVVEGIIPSNRPEQEQRRSRSLSTDRASFMESGTIDVYGFARKRSVSNQRLNSNRELLHHNVTESPKTPRVSARQVQADQRFKDLVAHIKEKNAETKQDYKSFKERNTYSTGLLENCAAVVA